MDVFSRLPRWRNVRCVRRAQGLSSFYIDFAKAPAMTMLSPRVGCASIVFADVY